MVFVIVGSINLCSFVENKNTLLPYLSKKNAVIFVLMSNIPNFAEKVRYEYMYCSGSAPQLYESSSHH